MLMKATVIVAEMHCNLYTARLSTRRQFFVHVYTRVLVP